MEVEALWGKLNALMKSGKVGRAETTVLTYDGSQFGTDVLGDGNLYTKVTAEPLDVDKLKKITITSKTDGKSFSYIPSQLAIGTEDGITAVAVDGLAYLLAFVIADNGVGIEIGTYVYSGADTYISCIETETITPIDPKYLLGVCLPVVKLTTQIAGVGVSVELSDSECAQLDVVVEQKSLCMVRFIPAGGMVFTLLASYSYTDADEIRTFKNQGPVFDIYFVKNDSGRWTATYSEG